LGPIIREGLLSADCQNGCEIDQNAPN
jgi:hypothetical protein